MTTRAKVAQTPSVKRAKLRPATNVEACAARIANIDARLGETFEKMLTTRKCRSHADEDLVLQAFRALFSEGLSLITSLDATAVGQRRSESLVAAVRNFGVLRDSDPRRAPVDLLAVLDDLSI